MSDKYGLMVPLCHRRCHEYGPRAVHRNAETMQRLHEWGQRKAMAEQGWSCEDFRRIFGRNYLPEDWTSEAPPEEEEEGFRVLDEEVRFA